MATLIQSTIDGASAASTYFNYQNWRDVTSSTLVRDSLGVLHKVFTLDSDDNLYYYTSSDNGATWENKTKIISSVVYNASLFVDANDVLHLVWIGSSDATLYYMFNNGTGWSTPVAGPAAGWYFAVDMDINGVIYCAYFYGGTLYISRMETSTATWFTSTTQTSMNNNASYWAVAACQFETEMGGVIIAYIEDGGSTLYSKRVQLDGSFMGEKVVDTQIYSPNSLSVCSNFDNIDTSYHIVLDNGSDLVYYFDQYDDVWDGGTVIGASNSSNNTATIMASQDQHLHVFRSTQYDSGQTVEYIEYNGTTWQAPVVIGATGSKDVNNLTGVLAHQIPLNGYIVTYKDPSGYESFNGYADFLEIPAFFDQTYEASISSSSSHSNKISKDLQINQDFRWFLKYDANELPDAATPAWSIYGDAGVYTEEINPAGIWSFQTQSAVEGGKHYNYSSAPLLSNPGAVLEVRAKIVSGSPLQVWENNTVFIINTDSNGAALYLFADGILFSDNSGAQPFAIDTTEYHTYRIETGIAVGGSNNRLYIDDVLIFGNLVDGVYGPANNVIFGVSSTGLGGPADTKIDYVAINTVGSKAPSGLPLVATATAVKLPNKGIEIAYYPPIINHPNLKSYYRFNAEDITKDEVGGRDLVNIGATADPDGSFGGCAYFGPGYKQGQHMYHPSNMGISSYAAPVTVLGTIEFLSLPTAESPNYPVFSISQDGQVANWFYFNFANGTVNAFGLRYLVNWTNQNSGNVPVDVVTGVKYRIAMVLNPADSTFKLYISGQEITSFNYMNQPGWGGWNSFVICNNVDQQLADGGADIKMDEVAILEYAMSAKELLAYENAITIDQFYLPATNDGQGINYSLTNLDKAQTFTPSITADIAKVSVKLANYSSSPTGSVYVEIWSDNGGQPGSLIVRSKEDLATSSLPLWTETASFDFTFYSGSQLIEGQQYWAIVKGDYAPSTTDFALLCHDNPSGGYTRGGAYANDGTSYVVVGDGSFDFYFEEYYYADGHVFLSKNASTSLVPSVIKEVTTYSQNGIGLGAEKYNFVESKETSATLGASMERLVVYKRALNAELFLTEVASALAPFEFSTSIGVAASKILNTTLFANEEVEIVPTLDTSSPIKKELPVELTLGAHRLLQRNYTFGAGLSLSPAVEKEVGIITNNASLSLGEIQLRINKVSQLTLSTSLSVLFLSIDKQTSGDTFGIVMTNLGKNKIAELIGGLYSPGVFNFIHLGGGSGSLNANNTTLSDEFVDSGLEPALANVTSNGNVITVSHRFTSTSGKTLKEFGIFDDNSAMIARATMHEVDMSAGNSVTIKFKLSIN